MSTDPRRSQSHLGPETEERKTGYAKDYPWFVALKKNEKADFRDWAASENFDEFQGLWEHKLRLPIELPRETLQFVQQAGLQMLHQWQTPVFIERDPEHVTTLASLMIAGIMESPVESIEEDIPNVAYAIRYRNLKHIDVEYDLAYFMRPPLQLGSDGELSIPKQATPTCYTALLISWSIETSQDEKLHGSDVSDMWENLNLDEGWAVGGRMI
ncbi:hypothetical protein FB567DRAFT_555648 [Paraphoma chrysanthemicola]|uniref:Uncharacterized protein n=1 Tax=Paraphoma chrysanthemicola TaxID=798071 RepID=A0A8K0QTK7_9PLEO|nr:hypothetical protein FB567DRAFT_555648 [Paraphoma chrysanthemicola]